MLAWILGLGAFAGIVAIVRAVRNSTVTVPKQIADSSHTLLATMVPQVAQETGIIPIGALAKVPIPPDDTWVQVDYNGHSYKVAPVYLAPAGIGEAQDLAKLHGWVLPSPGLVDAIWNAADLKVEPHPEQHDGTEKTMNSVALNTAHLAYIANQIAGQDFKLLAGTHKDVVLSKDGTLGIYGWHHLNGKPIQGFFSKHSHTWKDYSQGLRPIIQVS